MIKELINNWRERERKFKDFQEEDLIQRKIQERKLPHNERVLNTFLEEERQKEIKNQLKLFRLKKRFEEKKKLRNMNSFDSNMFKDDVIFTQENMFKNG